MSDEGPSGEEVKIWAYSRTACDKHDKVCECCNDLVSELNEVELELRFILILCFRASQYKSNETPT